MILAMSLAKKFGKERFVAIGDAISGIIRHDALARRLTHPVPHVWIR